MSGCWWLPDKGGARTPERSIRALGGVFDHCGGRMPRPPLGIGSMSSAVHATDNKGVPRIASLFCLSIYRGGKERVGILYGTPTSIMSGRAQLSEASNCT